jgi:zinc protease
VYSPNDIAIIVTGDAKEIKPKLARFGDVAVYDVDLKPASQMAYKPADLPLSKILDKFYSALGKQALEKVQDRTTEADVEISFNGQSMPGKLTSVEAMPNKKYERLSLTFGVMENWVDGIHVWQKQGPKAAELAGDDLKRELADAEFSPELRLGDASHKIGLLGQTTLKNGEEAYVLSLEKPNTNPEKWYISTKSGLLVQREISQQGAMTTMNFGDYRPVDGVMVPYSVALTGAQDLTLTVTSVKQNTHPDPAVFEKK